MAVIKDVAREAGVSVGTVSKYLNDPKTLTAEKYEVVKQAIQKLRYTPNIHARNLRMNDSRTIALIAQEIDNPFHAKLYSVMRKELLKYDYSIVLHSASDVDGDLSKLFDKLPVEYFSGIVLGYFHDMDKQIEFAKKHTKVPIVIMSNEERYTEKFETSKIVVADFKKGMEKACDYLINCGNNKISYVGCRADDSTEDRDPKLKGFLASMKKHGKIPNSIIRPRKEFSLETGCQSVGLLLKNGEVPDAIVVDSDILTIGIIRGLTDKGFNVPKDVMVMSFDDIDIAEYFWPRLTTVKIPIEEMCISAVKKLLNQIEKTNRKCKSIYRDFEIYERETTYKR